MNFGSQTLKSIPYDLGWIKKINLLQMVLGRCSQQKDMVAKAMTLVANYADIGKRISGVEDFKTQTKARNMDS